jgi:hypothetical protein
MQARVYGQTFSVQALKAWLVPQSLELHRQPQHSPLHQTARPDPLTFHFWRHTSDASPSAGLQVTGGQFPKDSLPFAAAPTEALSAMQGHPAVIQRLSTYAYYTAYGLPHRVKCE